MDHLKWDSSIYEEYIANLQKMSQCMEKEIQNLTGARKSILRQNVTEEDQALQAVLEKLDETLGGLNVMADRIHQLREALELSMDIFVSAEKKIGNMGSDLLYAGVMQAVSMGEKYPLYTAHTGAFATNEVTPEWLAALSGENTVSV